MQLARKVAMAVCYLILFTSLLTFLRHIANGPNWRPLIPAIFYGLSLVALLKPERALFSYAALFVALLFIGAGIYGIYNVWNASSYRPWQPLAFVVLPALFVASLVVIQIRAARARGAGSRVGV